MLKHYQTARAGLRTEHVLLVVQAVLPILQKYLVSNKQYALAALTSSMQIIHALFPDLFLLLYKEVPKLLDSSTEAQAARDQAIEAASNWITVQEQALSRQNLCRQRTPREYWKALMLAIKVLGILHQSLPTSPLSTKNQNGYWKSVMEAATKLEMILKLYQVCALLQGLANSGWLDMKIVLDLLSGEAQSRLCPSSPSSS